MTLRLGLWKTNLASLFCMRYKEWIKEADVPEDGITVVQARENETTCKGSCVA